MGTRMRILFAAIVVLLSAGCTSILLGNASADESAISTDNRSGSQIAADKEISATIRRKFRADDAVRQYSIGISTIDSNVTLSGTVGSYPARDRAVQIATETEGVRSVTSRIIVNTNL